MSSPPRYNDFISSVQKSDSINIFLNRCTQTQGTSNQFQCGRLRPYYIFDYNSIDNFFLHGKTLNGFCASTGKWFQQEFFYSLKRIYLQDRYCMRTRGQRVENQNSRESGLENAAAGSGWRASVRVSDNPLPPLYAIIYNALPDFIKHLLHLISRHADAIRCWCELIKISFNLPLRRQIQRVEWIKKAYAVRSFSSMH